MSLNSYKFIDEQRQVNRYVMYPIIYPKINSLYEQLRDSYWTAEEVDLSKDINDWNTKLSHNDRKFIKNVLSFFVSSDSVVQENLIMTFLQEITLLEARAFYSMQIANEQIHQDMYKKMLITYITDQTELYDCFNAVYDVGFITNKTKWAEKWINKSDKLSHRLVAFAIVEGIFFSSAFASIYWLKKRNIMPGLTSSNEFISRDESRHTDHAIVLYDLLLDKLNENEVHDIFKEGVDIECIFVDNCLQTNLIGMNAELMKQYVKYCADRLMIQFGYNKIYNVNNPFDFMELISLDGKSNFFEHRVTEYNKSNAGNGFSIIDDF
jgi:ribonucleotide reductase beta subunit family protein with ferritin-like domain